MRNPAEHAIDVYLRGRSPTFDVVIARESGGIVWRRLQNEIIPGILMVRSLAPSEEFELSAQWDGRENGGRLIEPGNYTAGGFLLVEGEPLETPPVSLVVTAQ